MDMGATLCIHCKLLVLGVGHPNHKGIAVFAQPEPAQDGSYMGNKVDHFGGRGIDNGNIQVVMVGTFSLAGHEDVHWN